MFVLKLIDIALQSRSISLLQLIYVSLASLIIVVVGNLIRNRYHHPLHKFPGPFSGSITDFYKTYLLSTGNYHERVRSLHQVYGEWLDFGLWSLSFSSTCPRTYCTPGTQSVELHRSTPIAQSLPPSRRKDPVLQWRYSRRNCSSSANTVTRSACSQTEGLSSDCGLPPESSHQV